MSLLPKFFEVADELPLVLGRKLEKPTSRLEVRLPVDDWRCATLQDVMQAPALVGMGHSKDLMS